MLPCLVAFSHFPPEAAAVTERTIREFELRQPVNHGIRRQSFGDGEGHKTLKGVNLVSIDETVPWSRRRPLSGMQRSSQARGLWRLLRKPLFTQRHRER